MLLTHVELLSTDTGPAAAGATFEVWLFNADPTATRRRRRRRQCGLLRPVKQAGFIGRLQGTFIAASDGSVLAICTPV